MSNKSAALTAGSSHGRLTATEATEYRKRSDGRNRLYQTFDCICGNSITLPPYSVVNGNTSSCGCLHSETVSSRMKKHGLSKTSAYRVALNKARRLTKRANSKGVYVNNVTSSLLKDLLSQYENCCWICEMTLDEVCWDHVQPLSKGGSHTLDNLKPSCRSCNSRKGVTWPFTEDNKNKIASVVRALRATQDISLVTDSEEVIA